MKKALPYLVFILSIIISALSLVYYPDRYAIHWGYYGEADGFSKKGLGLFFIPILMILMYFFLHFVPKLDPEKKNIEKFYESYNLFVNGFLLFFLYLQITMFIYNVIAPFNFIYGIIPELSGLFYGLSYLLENTKKNYSIGIRTPWTLASEEVWDKTHKLGAKLIRYAALVTLIGLFLPSLAILIFMVSIFGTFGYLFWYSYYEFKRL